MVFNESQKYIFLTLEMSVDRAFRSAGESSDLPQFGTFVPISHEDLFGSLEQQVACFLGSEFVLVYFLRSHLSRFYLSQRSPRHSPLRRPRTGGRVGDRSRAGLRR